MLARWLEWLVGHGGAVLSPAAGANITTRAALAAGISFGLALVLGRQLIAWLGSRFREPIKSASPRVERLHSAKQATPTMGGLFIVGAIVLATVACGDLTNRYLCVTLATLVALAALGAVDDLAKLRTTARGIAPRAKLLGQTLIATAAALAIYGLHSDVPHALDLTIPAWSGEILLSWAFVPLAVIVIVGSSNAVNLTDGLDGLAGGCLLFGFGGMGIVSYASGHRIWAAYLHLPHVPGAGETVVVAGATLGALLGFLWFNCHPAAVFMGDTGALPLGGLLGLMAVICRQELLLAVIGGVFVAEAGSVILQVLYFRLTGRRVFLCAPLHHHFQFRGWAESKIVTRFWIVAALCCIAGLATLRLAAPQTVTAEEDSVHFAGGRDGSRSAVVPAVFTRPVGRD